MIASAFVERRGRNHLEQAGIDAERQLAHYLGREFGVDPRVQLYFGLRLLLGETGGAGDAVQIDALIVHKHGMAIVESKSVHDEVRVNERGEWARTFRGKAYGMASPVEQAQRQAGALRKVLVAHKARLRDRKILGLVQGGFDACPIEIFVAIADRGRIMRQRQGLAPEVMKADQIAANVRKRIDAHRRAGSLLGIAFGPKTDDGLYVLTEEEMERVRKFLMATGAA